MKALAFIFEIILRIILFLYAIILFPIVIITDILDFFIDMNDKLFNYMSDFLNKVE